MHSKVAQSVHSYFLRIHAEMVYGLQLKDKTGGLFLTENLQGK